MSKAPTRIQAIDSTKKYRPATSPESRENQVISLAMDLAEKQIREGTASSQVISHFLKVGSAKDRLERDILKEQKKLLEAKTEAIKSQKIVEELYTNALSAMRNYSGQASDDNGADDHD